jgi:hypothetical protein
MWSRISSGSEQDHGAFDNVLQLADVPRPGIVLEEFGGAGGEAGELFPQFPVELLQQFEREGHDVFFSLAQRRNEKRDDIEPVVEVFAELAAGHCFFQVGVRGGDKADIDLDGTGSAEPVEGAVLKHAQQLGLHAVRHGRNLVEKERAAMGAFGQAFFAAAGVGKSARLEAEEFTLEQVSGVRLQVSGLGSLVLGLRSWVLGLRSWVLGLRSQVLG